MGSSGDIVLDAPRVLVGEAEALLAVPAAVDVDASGNVYVVDRQDRQVRVFTRGGEPIRTIGGPGEGPGEFARPQFLGVSDGVVRVLDTRRGTVQAFSTSGTHIESYSTSAAGTVGHAADFDRDGTLVFSSLETPRRGGLVEIVDPEGAPSRVFGDPIGEERADGNFITDEIHQRRIPQFMRNHVLPIVDPGGDLWLFLQSEGTLRRYRLDGTLLHSVGLDEREMEAIRDEYFEWYEAFDQGVLRYFTYVVDGFATGDGVWLLWATPVGHSNLITVHDESGTILLRLRFSLPTLSSRPPTDPSTPRAPSVTRRFFALDEDARTVYVADTDTSSLYALDLPDGVLR